jgi:glycosyltransferase involved in cell wall biosynthesis
MKILHITFSLLNGGKENILVDIANEQFKIGNTISVLLINNIIDKDVLNRIDLSIEVIKLNRESNLDTVLMWFQLMYFINIKIKPDIIHCHDIILGKLLKTITKARLVITLHALGLPSKNLRYFKKIFAISEIVKSEIESRSNIRPIIVKNGICFSDIKFKENRAIKGKVKLIQVSNLLHLYKGQDILIEALNIIVNEMKIKDIRLDFVGEGTSRLLLEKMIKDYNLINNIFLLGGKNREWVYNNLCNYDIFIQPSRNEGFGLTVVEALAAKVPVIASNINGPAEILCNGKLGLLFESENHVDLAKNILELIKNFSSLKTQNIIEYGYQYSLIHFNVKQTAKNYCDNYF